MIPPTDTCLFGLWIRLSTLERKMYITYNSWLQVHEECSGHVLPSSGLTKEGIERCTHRLRFGTCLRILPAVENNTIWLDSVFQAVELPTGIPNLDASLANVDRQALPLK